MRPIRTVILDGLLDGMEGNVLGAFQGGNGAGNFEDAGVGLTVGVERHRVSQRAVILTIVRGDVFVRQKKLQLVPQ